MGNRSRTQLKIEVHHVTCFAAKSWILGIDMRVILCEPRVDEKKTKTLNNTYSWKGKEGGRAGVKSWHICEPEGRENQSRHVGETDLK